MKNFFTGVGMLALSIFVYFNLGIKLRPDLIAGGINEAAWPKALLFIMAGFSILLIISAIRKGELKELKGLKVTALFNRGSFRLVLALILCFVYIAVVGYLGFAIATPLLLIGLLYLIGYRGFLKLIPGPIVITIVITLLFAKVINVPLPLGTGFLQGINSIFA